MSARVAAMAFAIALLSSGTARAACSLTVGGIAFGVYDVYQVAPTDSTGTITYRCGNTDKDIRISISRGSSPTFAPRELRSGSEMLAYNLFLDAAFTQIWGDGTGGTGTYFIHNPRNNVDIDLTVFSRLPPGQDVAPGGYSDTVVVTLDY
jgi:spore coat protein U-like protein